LEVEILYHGVALDSLGVGYETFPEDVRDKVLGQFPRTNFKTEIAQAFFEGFGYKPQTTEYTCNEDVCSHFIRDYRRKNFYDQVMNSSFRNSWCRSDARRRSRPLGRPGRADGPDDHLPRRSRHHRAPREAELVPDEIHQLRGILAIVDRESGIEADLVGMFTQQSSRCRERYPPSLVRRS
jgi:hypothetical protein